MNDLSVRILTAALCMSMASITMASACPYTEYAADATILVADTDICLSSAGSSVLCLVDAACRKVGDVAMTPYNISNIGIINWIEVTPAAANTRSISAIGNLSALTTFGGLTINCTATNPFGAPLQVTDMELATTVVGLAISHCPLHPSSFDRINWAKSSVTIFLLDFNGLESMPTNLPKSATYLVIQDNELTTLTGFRTWDNLLRLDLSENNLQSVADLDWSNLTTITLDRNPNLTNLTNVALSRRLTSMSIQGCNLSNVMLDKVSADAVAALQLSNDTDTNANEVVLFVDNAWPFNGRACDDAGGTKRVLHENYNICLVPDTPSHANWTVPLVLGSVGLVVGILASVWLYRRRRLRASQKDVRDSHINTPTSSLQNTKESTSLDLEALVLCRLDDADLEVGKTMASGANGVVSRGRYKNQPVAIKRLTAANHALLSDIQKFVQEIKLLAAIDSPHVVKLVGCVWTQPRDMKAVLEWMDSGDLRDCLANNPHLSWPQKLSYLDNIVSGLVYIHTMDVVHRDLKSRNIVLDSTKGAKLTDFGTARVDTSDTMTIGVGTYRWMAPEVLQSHSYSVAADIYSLGVVVSELDTHCVPYSDMKNGQGHPLVDTAIVGMVLSGSLKPTFSTTCPPWLHALAVECLEFDPAKRPTAMQVMYRLHQVAIDRMHDERNRMSCV
ncbi:Aste57867_12127 [Aphanomyces stellatus]|uniref:Aste57867_12127 protein n=1 Tax=Aphanomyces stellatus TaxID=120398 RepID=A0A485KUP9_9STRA|nr:hypothetical protein As57867_012082 [Aphanomyces stellatus]VFT88981.1 Aste57867_12127 [Aphanomyces stellatus]